MGRRRDRPASNARFLASFPDKARAAEEDRALEPPHAKDGPAGRLRYEQAVKRAAARALGIEPADTE